MTEAPDAHPQVDNQKCPQILPNVPRGARSQSHPTQVENDCCTRKLVELGYLQDIYLTYPRDVSSPQAQSSRKREQHDILSHFHLLGMN